MYTIESLVQELNKDLNSNLPLNVMVIASKPDILCKEVTKFIGRENLKVSHSGAGMICKGGVVVYFLKAPALNSDEDTSDYAERFSDALHGVRYQRLYILDVITDYWLRRLLASYRPTRREHDDYFIEGMNKLRSQLPEEYSKYL